MPWEFTENHVRPNVFYWSPQAHQERQEVQGRRKEAQSNFLASRRLIGEGRLEEAEQQLQGAVASWPDNPKYLLGLAECIRDCMHDPKRAMQWFDRLVEVEDTAAHRAARARGHACLGHLQDALNDVRAALHLEPRSGVYLRAQAVLQQRMGAYDDALRSYSRAQHALKDDGHPLADCVANQAYCLRLLRRGEEALKRFEEAAAMAPGDQTVKCLLGCALFDRRRYREALGMFESNLIGRPASAAAHNNVAVALYQLAMAEAERASHAEARATVERRMRAASSRQPRPGGSSAPSRQSSVPAPPADDADDLSDEDEEEDTAAAGEAGVGGSNEDPRQWALQVVQSGGGGVLAAAAGDGSVAARLASLLERAVGLLDAAQARAERDEAEELRRLEAGAPRPPPPTPAGDGGMEVHALEVHVPGRALDGVLLLLVPASRIPGMPAVHDLELQAGEVQFNRGLVSLALGRLDEAGKDLASALDRNPFHAHYPHYRAVVHARKGALEEAVHWNLVSLSLNENYYPALYHLGLVLHLLGRNAEAIHRLDGALDQGVQRARSWALMEARGRVMQELDRQVEAIKALQEALELLAADDMGPPTAAARLHYAIAQSAIATHNSSLFRSSLRQARMYGQNAASVYNLRGLLALRERRLAKALAYLSRAVRLAPQEARFLFDRSQAYMEQGTFAAATQDMSAALQLLPTCASLHFHRAVARYAMHDEEAALEDLEAAAELVQEAEAAAQPSPREHLSSSRRQGGAQGPQTRGGALRMDVRLWEGSKVMAGSPVPPDLTPSLWYYLGCVRARLGSFPAAAEAFERAHLLLPSHPAILHELAKCHQATGQFQKALQGFERVLALQPRNAHALFRRGLALKSLGQYQRAADDILTAQTWDPRNPALRVDFRQLSAVDVIELCKPGLEAAIAGSLLMRSE